MCMELINHTVLYPETFVKGVDFMLCIFFCFNHTHTKNGGSDGKESACSAGDLSLILGLGRSPGGNSLQNSCLENSMDRGAWWAAVPGVAKSQT